MGLAAHVPRGAHSHNRAGTAVTQCLPTLELEIESLLGPAGRAPSRDTVEYTLTTGYAHALELEGVRPARRGPPPDARAQRGRQARAARGRRGGARPRHGRARASARPAREPARPRPLSSPLSLGFLRQTMPERTA